MVSMAAAVCPPLPGWWPLSWPYQGGQEDWRGWAALSADSLAVAMADLTVETTAQRTAARKAAVMAAQKAVLRVRKLV